jgi:serine phosphatase RsbU (regulator of sigma subunit)
MFEAQNILDSATDYYKKYILLNDSLKTLENKKKIADLGAFYEADKKDAEMETHQAEIDKQTETEKTRQQELFFLLGGIFALLILIFLIIYNFFQKKKINRLLAQTYIQILQQKEEIESQRDLATTQRDLILEQKKSITESIEYAYRIQSAIIPDEEYLRKFFDDIFVIYKPKEIVSGDFYWIGNINNNTIFVGADCTNNGVPGALMSLLGYAFINEIVMKEHIVQPNKILESLGEKIYKSLNKQDKKIEFAGLDVSVISINPEDGVLQFAGTGNPLFILKTNKNKDEKSEILTIPGDNKPLQVAEKTLNYNNNTINLNNGDTVYIMSDGFIRQPVNNTAKPFGIENTKKLLESICDNNLKKQKEIIENEFNRIKGESEQLDDILFVAIKI